mmetsp:Transcript_100692/g.260063  ORF Transcript_100692/g.260063 Transcript_100692/m.260063 type:complete len:216 (-) Transcript_100692:586-1233(-)
MAASPKAWPRWKDTTCFMYMGSFWQGPLARMGFHISGAGRRIIPTPRTATRKAARARLGLREPVLCSMASEFSSWPPLTTEVPMRLMASVARRFAPGASRSQASVSIDILPDTLGTAVGERCDGPRGLEGAPSIRLKPAMSVRLPSQGGRTMAVAGLLSRADSLLPGPRALMGLAVRKLAHNGGKDALRSGESPRLPTRYRIASACSAASTSSGM